jgi:hypothetical protein
MPASGRGRQVLVDTSVVVALTVADHEHHDATFGALGSRRLGLAGHAAFETFSVLTRLPHPARRTRGPLRVCCRRAFRTAGSWAPRPPPPCSPSCTAPRSPAAPSTTRSSAPWPTSTGSRWRRVTGERSKPTGRSTCASSCCAEDPPTRGHCGRRRGAVPGRADEQRKQAVMKGARTRVGTLGRASGGYCTNGASD